MDTAQDKQALRVEMRRQKKALGSEALSAMSVEICRRLEQAPEWQQARRVLLYASLPDEVDTRDLLARYHREKEIYLPVVEGDHLRLRRYQAGTRMEKNQWSIDEPNDTQAELTDLSLLQLAVIPGMAFDGDGYRLGRGKGYYDRLLPLLSCPVFGLCFPFQQVETLPREPWDRAVNRVI